MSFSANMQAQRHLRLVSVENASVSQSYLEEPEPVGRNYTALLVCSVIVLAIVAMAIGAAWLGGYAIALMIA